jgi:hypothetical protein
MHLNRNLQVVRQPGQNNNIREKRILDSLIIEVVTALHDLVPSLEGLREDLDIP